jgi:hypothetical protein
MNLFFCIINNGYRVFALNFFKRWKELQIQEELLFVCTDSSCYEFIKKEGANCILYEKHKVSDDFEIWDTDEYKNIVFRKLDITKKIIEEKSANHSFITYIDTDIWINLDFTSKLNNVLKTNQGFDIIFQDGEDYLSSSDECCILNDDDTLTKLRECKSYCTGFMVFNNSKKRKILELLSYDEDQARSHSGNQSFINEKLSKLGIQAYTIPKCIFPNFSTSFYFKELSDYWMLHYTYLVGKEKIYYMKKNKHWLID